MSKEIVLNNGMIAIVDDEDFELLNQYKWHSHKHRNTFYACRSGDVKKTTKVKMHRQVINADNNCVVDHINKNGLDNRKSNLRVCTNSENLRNRNINKNNFSGYKGVSWKKLRCKWAAQICVNNNHIFLGYYNCLIKAAKTYNEAALKYHGEFASLNDLSGGDFGPALNTP